MCFASSDVHSCVFVSFVFLDVDFSICVVIAFRVFRCSSFSLVSWAGWRRVAGGVTTRGCLFDDAKLRHSRAVVRTLAGDGVR